MKIKDWNWYILTAVLIVISFWVWVAIALNID